MKNSKPNRRDRRAVSPRRRVLQRVRPMEHPMVPTQPCRAPEARPEPGGATAVPPIRLPPIPARQLPAPYPSNWIPLSRLPPRVVVPHRTFETVTIHTAICDVCNQRNYDTLQRCCTCGWSVCKPCWLSKGGDGSHVINAGDIGWTVNRVVSSQPKVNEGQEKRQEARTALLEQTEGTAGSNANPDEGNAMRGAGLDYSAATSFVRERSAKPAAAPRTKRNARGNEKDNEKDEGVPQRPEVRPRKKARGERPTKNIGPSGNANVGIANQTPHASSQTQSAMNRGAGHQQTAAAQPDPGLGLQPSKSYDDHALQTLAHAAWYMQKMDEAKSSFESHRMDTAEETRPSSGQIHEPGFVLTPEQVARLREMQGDSIGWASSSGP